MKRSYIEKILKDRDSSINMLRDIENHFITLKNKVFSDIENAKKERSETALSEAASEAHKIISSDIAGLTELVSTYDEYLVKVRAKIEARKVIINGESYKESWSKSEALLDDRMKHLEEAEASFEKGVASLVQAVKCGTDAVNLAPSNIRSLESPELHRGKELLDAYIQFIACRTGAIEHTPELRNIWPSIHYLGGSKLFEIFAKDAQILLNHKEVDEGES
ncbi:MAG: hypothetical protein ACMZ64_07610 [Oleiphilus sp.]